MKDEYITALEKSILFLEAEILRLRGVLSSLKPESKEHSRILKNYLALEKRYFTRSIELENLENFEPAF